jgi:hypothetical protein
MNPLLRRPHADGCPSGLTLDRRLAGELEGSELAALDRHLESCLACASRLAQDEAFRERFQASPPPLRRGPAAGPVQGRPATLSRRRQTVAGALALAAAGLALAWGLPRLDRPDPGSRLKGNPRLEFFVQRSGQVQRGKPGDVLAPGARVQFAYSHSGRFWLAVLSLDGAGKASIYFPDGDVAAEMPGGSNQALPVSTVLDEALGTERIYGLFCDAPVALGPIREMLARGQTEPSSPAGCRMLRLSWDKRPLR